VKSGASSLLEKTLSQTGGAAWAGEHAGRRNAVTATRAVEPVAAVLALRIGETLLAFAFGTLAVHFTLSDVVFENQPALGTDLCVTTMIGGLATWRRTGKNRVA